MNRTNRIALMAAAVLVLVVTGTVFATRAPSGPTQPAQVTQDEEDAPPTAEEIAHAADRLHDKLDITVDDAVFNELVTAYGVGGAVRIMAWSGGDSAVITRIRDMRDGDGSEDSGMGWGRIAKELGFSPGIGAIMGNGGGHGRDNAPGQQGRDAEEGASGD